MAEVENGIDTYGLRDRYAVLRRGVNHEKQVVADRDLTFALQNMETHTRSEVIVMRPRPPAEEAIENERR